MMIFPSVIECLLPNWSPTVEAMGTHNNEPSVVPLLMAPNTGPEGLLIALIHAGMAWKALSKEPSYPEFVPARLTTSSKKFK